MILQYIRRLRHGPLKFLNPLWLFLGTQYRKIVSKINFSVKHRIGIYGPFKINARFTFSNFENWGGGHNNGFEYCVEACRNKKCIIDVGAHIGLVSLPIASVMPSDGILISFEPGDINRKLLEYHIKINGFNKNVRVESHLVGEKKANEVSFFEINEPTGMNSLAEISDNYKCVTKSQVCLDDYCKENQLCPDVIKIDVEGAELNVLKGAKDIIIKFKPQIFLSVHPKQIKMIGHTLEELTDFITSLNYIITQTDGSRVTELKLCEYLLHPEN